jgi:hypothetical protein
MNSNMGLRFGFSLSTSKVRKCSQRSEFAAFDCEKCAQRSRSARLIIKFIERCAAYIANMLAALEVCRFGHEKCAQRSRSARLTAKFFERCDVDIANMR